MKTSTSETAIKHQKTPASTIPIQAAFKLFCLNNQKSQTNNNSHNN